MKLKSFSTDYCFKCGADLRDSGDVSKTLYSGSMTRRGTVPLCYLCKMHLEHECGDSAKLIAEWFKKAYKENCENEKPGFTKWLARQTYDNARGDLARDMLADPNWPSNARRHKVFRSYLEDKNACEAALETFEKAWADFTKRNTEKPFPIGLLELYDTINLPLKGTHQLIWQKWPALKYETLLEAVRIEVDSVTSFGKGSRVLLLETEKRLPLFCAKNSTAYLEIALEGNVEFKIPIQKLKSGVRGFKFEIPKPIPIKNLRNLRTRILWEPEPISYNVDEYGKRRIRVIIKLDKLNR